MAIERLTPERRRELTREALLAAAAETFSKKGFAAASLDEIADTAGFTKGAIYSNFSSKEELLHAVLGRWAERQLSEVADAMNADYSGDQVHNARTAATVWDATTEYADEQLIALSLELRLYALRNGRARERIAELNRKVTDQLAGYIEEELARRGTPSHLPARQLAELGRAALDGLQQYAAIDPSRAGEYQQLIKTLFVLLAKAAASPGWESPDGK